jgi:hypothetical protein
LTNRLSNVSGIGFREPHAEAAEVVIERLQFAKGIRESRATDGFADVFAKSHMD